MLGQRVCVELNNPLPLHHSMDVCLLFHFTEEGKHLEVIFPLAFHSFHHLPLWETLKASVQFHWKEGKTLSCLLTLFPAVFPQNPTWCHKQKCRWFRLPTALAIVIFVLIVLTSHNVCGKDESTSVLVNGKNALKPFTYLSNFLQSYNFLIAVREIKATVCASTCCVGWHMDGTGTQRKQLCWRILLFGE